jgi:hypothetical protein
MEVDPKRQDGGPPYVIHRLASWEEFLEWITDSPYSNWAFRGLCEARWPLSSALARYLHDYGIDQRAWREQEQRILRIFKRKAHHFLRQPPDRDDDFQWLGLMQHHGAPTRLLDFTKSPYVAAFFALIRARSEAAVWAVNPIPISYAESVTVSDSTTLHPRQMDPSLKGNLHRYYFEADMPFVWMGEQDIMSRRLIAQSGTFAISGTLTRSMDEILSGYPDPKNTLVKFVLPCDKMRSQGLRELYRMNITYETLFPDLDGLGRSLAYELEFNWQFDPHTMERLVQRH